MRKRLLTSCFAAACVTFMFGCAPQTETIKLFEEGDRERSSFGRLLVVDLSSEPVLRQQFEDELVSRLAQENVDAIASHSHLKNDDGLLQEDINRVSTEVDADGILITHIVSLETTAERKEGREDIVRTCRQGDPEDYFLYDSEVLKEPDSVKIAHTVVVVSNLYDVASRERIWTIQSTCFEKESLAEVFIDEAEAVVRQLRIDELI